MCLLITKDHPRTPAVPGERALPPKVAVADRNYRVYKRVEKPNKKFGLSPLRGTIIVFGVLLTAEKLGTRWNRHNGRWMVEAGWHAFRTWRAAEDRMYAHPLLPCIIPEGAKLYYGERGEVVSDKLIVFRDNKALNKWVKEQEQLTCA